MGLTVGDANNDGLMDIVVTNFINDYNTFYLNEGSNTFRDRATALGLRIVGYPYSGWGTKFFDFDNDGWLDLFIANGHTMEQLERTFSRRYLCGAGLLAPQRPGQAVRRRFSSRWNPDTAG